MPKQYDLFLSYNSADHVEVSQILAKLRELPEPLTTFIDRETLTLGKPWFEEIQAALLNCRAVAVFYGKNGLGRWQNKEMILAIDQQATVNPSDSKILVIPVLLPGANLENAPRFLLLNTFLDLRSPDSYQNLQRFATTILKRDTAHKTTLTLDSLPPRDALRNPYRGLDYFREEDAPLFFGREAIAQKLLEKVKTCALMALVGNSGTGKSSVVRAGLLPLLRRQHAPDAAWEVIVCIPAKDGVNPFHNLARAFLESWNYAPDEIVNKRQDTENTLRQSLSLTDSIAQTLKLSQGADKLLLIIDQFEELLIFDHPDTETRAAKSAPATQQSSDFALFVELLLNAIQAPNCRVLLAIRGDYYGTVTERHARLAEIIEKGTVTLNRLEDQQLREIIEAPAALGGGKFEPGLAERIIDDVEKQPGNLALLEFALTSLWNCQHDGWLTHAAYENEVGKLEGAISKKADEILAGLHVGSPQLALTALTRLVRVSSNETDGGDTRQRVALSEFNATERACLEAFVKARLLVASGSWHESGQPALPANETMHSNHGATLEVAHEALIRHWPTLQDALKDKRELLLWRQTIRPQYESWQQSNKAGGKALDDFLLQGFPLKQGLKWLAERPYDLTDEEARFLKLSQTKAKKEQVSNSFFKKASITLTSLIVLIALPVQIFAFISHEPWSVAAHAVYVRVANRIPGLEPSWIPKTIKIPAGTFSMGSPEPKPPLRAPDNFERSQHKVTVKAFEIGVYEVKFSEYAEFVKDKNYQCKKHFGNNPKLADSGWGFDNQPAINLSWKDAECYAEWLSFLTGKSYRLPTEAEWEYAARAGSSTAYWWSDSIGKNQAVCDGCGSQWDKKRQTAPVGSFKANPFGLYDTAGNVYEWTQDCWHGDYKNAPSDGSVWLEADKGECDRRVIRGGSWYGFPQLLRSAFRGRGDAGVAIYLLGFRIARAL